MISCSHRTTRDPVHCPRQQLLDVFGHDSNMHLVLELCSGKDLEQLIRDDKRVHFSPADIKSFLLQT